ncbi:echinoderm microtubule-associated protein-like CG42247 isoform X2 [Patella vulgata]|nr:echinoderm microtubule-associated protein-like CG42247 isoform X2 [Patella vulgata]
MHLGAPADDRRLKPPALDLKFSKDSEDFIKSGSDEDYQGHYPASPKKAAKRDIGIKQMTHPEINIKPAKSHKVHKRHKLSGHKKQRRKQRHGSEADSETESDANTIRHNSRPPRKPYRNYKDYYDSETQEMGNDPRSFHHAKRQSRAHILSRAELLLDRRKSYPYAKSDIDVDSPLPELDTGRSMSLGNPSPLPRDTLNGLSRLAVDGYKPQVFKPQPPLYGFQDKDMNSRSSFYPPQIKVQQPSQSSFNASSVIKPYEPQETLYKPNTNQEISQAAGSKVYQYGNTYYSYKENKTNNKPPPSQNLVGNITMNALWNLQKETKNERTNMNNLTPGQGILSLAGHWDDLEQSTVIETVRSSYSVRDNNDIGNKRTGLKSFRSMQKQRRSENGYESNGSSQILSDDEDDERGFDGGEVIYSTSEAPMNDERRYEELRQKDKQAGDGAKDQQENGLGKKGRRVIFFRNGDPNFKGKEVLINQRNFHNYEKLLVELSETIPTPTGVKYIFSYPQGNEVKSLLDLENGQAYIVSSVNKLNKSVSYGRSRENYWQNSRLNHDDLHLFKGPDSKPDSTTNNAPKAPMVVTIIGNLKRDSKYKMLLNPHSERNFEYLLEDISQMVTIEQPPLQSLWTSTKPMEKIESFSALKSYVKSNHTEFLAVGQEGVPMEMETAKKGQLPNRHSSNESLNGKKKQTNGGRTPTLERRTNTSQNNFTAASNGVDGSRKKGSFKEKRWTDTTRIPVKGKAREFHAPSVPDPDDDGKEPNMNLTLDWVYGFRGRDVRDNLIVLKTGEIVYYVGAVVVIYNRKDDTQRHYLGHNEEVTCIALHPDKCIIATGQLGGKSADCAPHVRIWNGITLSDIDAIGYDFFNGTVITVAFSAQSKGALLMAIDDSDKHVLSVWDLYPDEQPRYEQLRYDQLRYEEPRAKRLAWTTTTPNTVTSGSFYPDNDQIIITYGKEHVFFWKLFWKQDENEDVYRILKDKLSGKFEDGAPKLVTSICFTPTGDVLTGDSDGSIVVWEKQSDESFKFNRNLSDKMKNAHRKSVNSLFMMDYGPLLSGGGNELKAWDPMGDFRQVKVRMLPEVAGNVRAIVPRNNGGQDGNLLIATTKSCILEGSMQHKFRFVIQGNSEEIWAIASVPNEASFITAGHDQLVMKWSTVSHAIMWRVQSDTPCVSVAVCPKGILVAVGTSNGRLLILKAEDGSQVTTTQVGKAQINAVNFSPDSNMLAIGGYDGFIHVFTINSAGQFFKTHSAALKNSVAFVSQIDWSCDNRYLQTVLENYELVYWDIENMQKVKNARTMRDVDWFTQTCSVGHSLIGPWSNLEGNEVINVAARSDSREYLVCGDNRGRIRLYKYPSSRPSSLFRNLKVYSNNVTAVTFATSDRCVVASGGNDAALFQWSLTNRSSY